YHLNTKRPNVEGGDSGLDETTSKSEFGPTLGYLNGGWRVLLTMFMSGTQEVATKNTDSSGVTGDVSIKNTDVSGFQVTTGYTFNLFSDTQIGPSLVYRSVSYKKQTKDNRLNATENYSGVPLF